MNAKGVGVNATGGRGPALRGGRGDAAGMGAGRAHLRAALAEFGQRLRDDLGDYRTDLRIAETVLRLALELRLGQPDGDHAHEPLPSQPHGARQVSVVAPRVVEASRRPYIGVHM